MENYPTLSQMGRVSEWHQADGIPLSEIQLFFRKNKVFDKDLSIEHEGKLYRLRCNDRAFTVYRVNPYQGLPPGIPGWPVCIVHESTIFQECRSPSLASDYLTCKLELNDWLEMVQRHCSQDLDT